MNHAVTILLEVRTIQFRCPNCQHSIQIAEQAGALSSETIDFVECPSCHSQFGLAADSEKTVIPEEGFRVNHFEVRELIGCCLWSLSPHSVSCRPCR